MTHRYSQMLINLELLFIFFGPFYSQFNGFLRFWRHGDIEDSRSKMVAMQIHDVIITPYDAINSLCGHQGKQFQKENALQVSLSYLKCSCSYEGGAVPHWGAWEVFNSPPLRYHLIGQRYNYPIPIILLPIFPFYLQQWPNEFLSWDASKYGDISRIHFAPNEIWVPDIALFNK